MLVTDRIFLGHYSVEAIAAVTPAGLMAFTFQAFFLGLGSYVNTFVAQYIGADRPERVGASLWQGLYFVAVASVVLALIGWSGWIIFDLAGHDPDVRELEVIYFRTLMYGGGLMILRDVLSCFYSGRGLTRVIMGVTITGACVNIPLDYALINGVWGFPELGIRGAALATVAGHALMVVLFTALIFTREHDRRFAVRRARAFDRALFARLIRFGTPSGAQFFMDIFAFSFFLLIVGRLGKTELAASNVAFAINTLGFLPMIGFSIGTSTLVGQAIGAGDPRAARRATIRTLELTATYMILVACVFVVFPMPLLRLFSPPGTADADYATIMALGKVLLRFVAAYTLIDAVNIILSGTLKGAGDTRFVGWTIAVGSVCLFVAPVYVALEVLGAGLYTAWFFAAFYVFAVAVFFAWRYRQRKWESMRVIEAHPPPVTQPAGVPGVDEVM
jgi:MATE family multidrug resistance protein